MSDIKKFLEIVSEGSMSKATGRSIGPKFVGKMKGTDPASARYSKYVGEEESATSLLKELEDTLNEQPIKRSLFTEYAQYLKEFGADNAPVQDPAKKMQSQADINKMKQNLQQLKPMSQGLNVDKTSQALAKVDAGGAMNQSDIQSLSKLAPVITDLLKDPSAGSKTVQTAKQATAKDLTQKLKGAGAT
jgi:hypothetical protein